VAPGYFWILPVGRDGVKRGICNVGMVVHDRDKYKGASLELRFDRWVKGSDKISAMFDGAEQISPWKGGKLSDITQDTKKAGDGFILIGDAASLMIPLFNDGLSAAADSAKAAADTAVVALRRNDFSEDLLLNGYEAALENQRGRMKKSFAADSRSDELKQVRLMMESLYDPDLMERIIKELEEDPGYRKKIIG
jgi:flavin-dependent dehydrogenase